MKLTSRSFAVSPKFPVGRTFRDVSQTHRRCARSAIRLREEKWTVFSCSSGFDTLHFFLVSLNAALDFALRLFLRVAVSGLIEHFLAARYGLLRLISEFKLFLALAFAGRY